MAVVNNLGTGEYVEKNMVFSKNIRGTWEARFECADGYHYSVNSGGTNRTAKAKAKEQLVYTVTHQTAHPVVPNNASK